METIIEFIGFDNSGNAVYELEGKFTVYELGGKLYSSDDYEKIVYALEQSPGVGEGSL